MTTLNLTHPLPLLLEEAARVAGCKDIHRFRKDTIRCRSRDSYLTLTGDWNPFDPYMNQWQRQAFLEGLARKGLLHYLIATVVGHPQPTRLDGMYTGGEVFNEIVNFSLATPEQLLQAWDAIYRVDRKMECQTNS